MAKFLEKSSQSVTSVLCQVELRMVVSVGGPSPGENEKSQCDMMVIIDDYSTYMLYGVYIYICDHIWIIWSIIIWKFNIN